MNIHKIIKLSAIPLNLLFLVILALHFLSILPPFWDSPIYFFYVALIVDTAFLAFTIKKIPEDERDYSQIVYYAKYLFLLILVVITLNQFLKRQIVIDLMPYLIGLAITSGFLTFFSHKERVEKELENEKSKEDAAEQQRKGEFAFKFPRINRIWGLKSIVKWMYKEGWWYSGGLLAITLGGFVLIVWNLNYIQGADNFNLLAAKALYQNGSFVYDTNKQITYLLAFLFKILGSSIVVARMPFAISGAICIFLIYFIGRVFDKRVGLISSFLLSVSPVAIEKSTFVRPYVEDLALTIIASLILISLFTVYIRLPKKFFKRYFLTVALISGTLLIYNQLMRIGVVLSVIFTMFLLSLPLFYWVISQNYPQLSKKALYALSTVLVVFIFTVHFVWQMISPGFKYNPYWFNMFFDPYVRTPMQWFSFSPISTFFIFSLFLLPLTYKFGKRIVALNYFVFFVVLSLYIFKFDNPLGYSHSRYLYFLYPQYIIIFSVSLFYFLVNFKFITKHILNRLFVVLFILIFIIVPQNTFHAATHDLSIWKEHGDPRQPTSAGNRNYFNDIFSFLNANNFSKNDAVVIDGENQFYFSWYYNYPLTRNYTNLFGDEYELGDKVYIIDLKSSVNQMSIAIENNPRGYLVARPSSYPTHNLSAEGVNLIYLQSIEGYKIYKWDYSK